MVLDATLPQSATATGKTAKRRGLRADIQGLRALAVLLVLSFHTGLPLTGGFTGVDVFFVISGFVITAMLLRELDRTDELSFSSFYSRRVRRILPALAAVIVVVMIGSAVLLSPLGTQQEAARTGGAASGFVANAELFRAPAGYFDAPAETNPLLHTWSLAVEEQFYLVFPALLLVAWRLGRRGRFGMSRRRAVGVLFALSGVVSFALSLFLTNWNSKFAFYASPARAWEFAVGALLALGVPYLERLNGTVAAVLAAIGLGIIAFGARAIVATTPFPGTAALLPVLGTALVIAGGTATTRGVSALLSTRPAVWLGDLSYGWYLWHWPAIVFARILWPGSAPWNTAVLVVAALLSLGPTYVSYRWLEQPIRFNTSLTGRRAIPVAAICIAIPLAACSALWLTSRALLSTRAFSERQAQGALHADTLRGCEQGVPVGQTKPACVWPAKGAQPTAAGSVILLGDSNAGHFSEPVIAAANGQGINVAVATSSGCPFVDLIVVYSTPFDSAGCRRFVTESLDAMRTVKPRLVVLASSSIEYLNPGNGLSFKSPASGEVASSAADKARLWEQGLASVLHRLQDAGVPTVVVRTVPHFNAFDLQLCPAYRVLEHADACSKSMSRAAIAVQQQAARGAETAAIATVQNATAVDFTDEICTEDRCSTVRGKQWLYRDGAHLSVPGALTLTDDFARLIKAHAA